ncbi:unnamed protein product [Phyllotreta striolata]|uniref:Uncharacterized protein n=1 Tax=Phyllotreta striolata TaxID=444603 RepID=A0A9N9XNB3_PHYSR|nr:unnamed protein product [Phyllotreta striolata]
MKIFVFLLLGVAAVSSLEAERLWNKFKVDFQKNYQNVEEETNRFQIFQDKLREIEEHNARYDRGEVSYYLGINQFSDYTHEEYLAMLNLHKKGPSPPPTSLFTIPEGVTLPDSIDWREKNVVAEVKNQGACGSCWAFSSTGGLEGQYALKRGKLVSLSEQNLLDCSDAYGNGNCSVGGLMTYAFNYVKDNGINSEAAYPYEAKQGPCRYNAQESIVHISGYEAIPKDEISLKYAVGLNGPISVAVDFSHAGGYAGGIYSDSSCSNKRDDLNHGVLVVGYGSENGMDYWIIKNSWSANFGENGYIRWQRNANNLCGIVDDASRPLVI